MANVLIIYMYVYRQSWISIAMLFGYINHSQPAWIYNDIIMFKQSDLLLAHKLDIFVTYHLKPLGVGVWWGGVGHVNVRLHLRHEVDATSRMGLGLRGVGWGMSTFACTCVMKLMLRYGWGWGWVGWGGACQRSLALASWSWCYVVGWRSTQVELTTVGPFWKLVCQIK